MSIESKIILIVFVLFFVDGVRQTIKIRKSAKRFDTLAARCAISSLYAYSKHKVIGCECDYSKDEIYKRAKNIKTPGLITRRPEFFFMAPPFAFLVMWALSIF